MKDEALKRMCALVHGWIKKMQQSECTLCEWMSTHQNEYVRATGVLVHLVSYWMNVNPSQWICVYILSISEWMSVHHKEYVLVHIFYISEWMAMHYNDSVCTMYCMYNSEWMSTHHSEYVLVYILSISEWMSTHHNEYVLAYILSISEWMSNHHNEYVLAVNPLQWICVFNVSWMYILLISPRIILAKMYRCIAYEGGGSGPRIILCSLVNIKNIK